MPEAVTASEVEIAMDGVQDLTAKISEEVGFAGWNKTDDTRAGSQGLKAQEPVFKDVSGKAVERIGGHRSACIRKCDISFLNHININPDKRQAKCLQVLQKPGWISG